MFNWLSSEHGKEELGLADQAQLPPPPQRVMLTGSNVCAVMGQENQGGKCEAGFGAG